MDSQVLNEYAKNFSESTIAKLPSDGLVSGKDIVTLTHSKQVNFFILKILYTQWQDEIKKLESPYFNYEHEEVTKALKSFMNVLSQHIEVAPQHLNDLISAAVKLTIRWLFFPAEVLAEEASANEIQQVKGIRSLSRYYKTYSEDLSYLLNSKENDEVTDFLKEWAQLMDQKSNDSIIEQELEFLSQTSPITKEHLFPEEALSSSEEENVASVEEEVVEENDEQALTSDEAEQPVEELIDEETSEEQADELSETSDSVEEAGETTKDLEEDPDEVEQGDLEDSVNQQYAQDQETLHDQYKEDQISVAAKHQQKKISSILEAVTVNQEYMFTSELFGGNKETFLEAVDKIEACSSFDESVETLVANYAQEYSWDMNGLEVKELLKVVFRRFR